MGRSGDRARFVCGQVGAEVMHLREDFVEFPAESATQLMIAWGGVVVDLPDGAGKGCCFGGDSLGR